MRPLTRTELPEYDDLAAREWISANGVGGFASGTVAGSATRRYHALLVAALPDNRRMTLLSDLEETLSLRGEHFNLSANRYPDSTVYPDGWKHVREFVNWPVPTWTYRLALAQTTQSRSITSGEEVTLVKRVFLARDRNTVYVTYTMQAGGGGDLPSKNPGNAVSVGARGGGGGGDAMTLRLAPLVAWKDYHAEMRGWPGFPTEQGPILGGWQLRATPDAPRLRFLMRGAGWTQADWWNENICHDRERERGQDFEEDLYCPALATLNLRSGQTAAFIATIEEDEPQDATLALAEILNHQKMLVSVAPPTLANDDIGRDLVLAADLFVVRLGAERRAAILAGYPWFTDWGRDTCIALPGLCLATGRTEIAREILEATAQHVRDGLIPNRFPDRAGATPDYNTADGTLWFLLACVYYNLHTNDSAFQGRMTPIVDSILEAHIAGTRYGIGMDAGDALLRAGEQGTQLTWMDAKVGDWVVTPRIGKPVEINVLWIAALAFASHGPNRTRYRELARQATQSFREKFVRPDGLGLWDVLGDDDLPTDDSIRPNQIFAAGLRAPISDFERLLTKEQTCAVVETVRAHLLTPYGLRTLAPTDAAYKGRYGGDVVRRDGAYHQGTVWPWFLRAYADACAMADEEVEVRTLIVPLLAHLREYGVGGIAEIFDGDAPHAPNGSPWQAWSLAELLRVYADSL